MPNRDAKTRKQNKRKLNGTFQKVGRTSIQYKKYLKKQREKKNV